MVHLLTDAEWYPAEYKRYRKAHQLHRRRGVYLHYAADGTCLYVGKGNSRSQGLDRCWANDWPDRRWILAVPVDEAWPHFTSSLEDYLIGRLRPRNNILGC